MPSPLKVNHDLPASPTNLLRRSFEHEFHTTPTPSPTKRQGPIGNSPYENDYKRSPWSSPTMRSGQSETTRPSNFSQFGYVCQTSPTMRIRGEPLLSPSPTKQKGWQQSRILYPSDWTSWKYAIPTSPAMKMPTEPILLSSPIRRRKDINFSSSSPTRQFWPVGYVNQGSHMKGIDKGSCGLVTRASLTKQRQEQRRGGHLSDFSPHNKFMQTSPNKCKVSNFIKEKILLSPSKSHSHKPTVVSSSPTRETLNKPRLNSRASCITDQSERIGTNIEINQSSPPPPPMPVFPRLEFTSTINTKKSNHISVVAS
eukprot:Awhi_evm1s13398